MKEEHIKNLEITLDSLVEDIKELEHPSDIKPLDVTVESDLDGTVREIRLTVTTGGPHIEIELFNQVIRGHWGSDTRTRHIRTTEGESNCEVLASYYKEQFDLVVGDLR